MFFLGYSATRLGWNYGMGSGSSFKEATTMDGRGEDEGTLRLGKIHDVRRQMVQILPVRFGWIDLYKIRVFGIFLYMYLPLNLPPMNQVSRPQLEHLTQIHVEVMWMVSSNGGSPKTLDCLFHGKSHLQMDDNWGIVL